MSQKTHPSQQTNPNKSAPASSSLDSHETIAEAGTIWRVPWSENHLSYSEEVRRRAQEGMRIPGATHREIEFRHSGWHEKRNKTIEALYCTHQDNKRVIRFKQCGGQVRTFWSPSERRFFNRGDYCHDRFCIACGTAKGACIAHNLEKLCKGRSLRFATLSRRSTGEGLITALNELQASFRRLQDDPAWQSCVEGGAKFIEIKRGKGRTHWHCHIHLLLEGSYINQRELSQMWRSASRGSFVVDIRAVDAIKGVVGYVCKYVSKPLDATVYQDMPDLKEAIIALKGRRLCNTFGTWRGTELEAKEPCPDDLIEVGKLDAILRLAAGGSRMAMVVIATISRSRPPELAIATSQEPAG